LTSERRSLASTSCSTNVEARAVRAGHHGEVEGVDAGQQVVAGRGHRLELPRSIMASAELTNGCPTLELPGARSLCDLLVNHNVTAKRPGRGFNARQPPFHGLRQLLQLVYCEMQRGRGFGLRCRRNANRWRVRQIEYPPLMRMLLFARRCGETREVAINVDLLAEIKSVPFNLPVQNGILASSDGRRSCPGSG
jgi:hypothetical protein